MSWSLEDIYVDHRYYYEISYSSVAGIIENIVLPTELTPYFVDNHGTSFKFSISADRDHGPETYLAGMISFYAFDDYHITHKLFNDLGNALNYPIRKLNKHLTEWEPRDVKEFMAGKDVYNMALKDHGLDHAWRTKLKERLITNGYTWVEGDDTLPILLFVTKVRIVNK